MQASTKSSAWILHLTCFPSYPMTVYSILFFIHFARYDKNPWSGTPAWSDPVTHPGLKIPIFNPKWRPYSWAYKSPVTLLQPKKLWRQLSIEKSSLNPLNKLWSEDKSNLSPRSSNGSLFGLSP